MSRLSREVFVERTRGLLTRQGTHDVSLATVLEACEANKGSLYHFFPAGKDELLLAAIERQSELALAINRRHLQEADSTADAVFEVVGDLARKMSASDFSLCLPFSAVGGMAGDSNEPLRLACQQTLEQLEALYAKSLRDEQVPAKKARLLASLIASSIEGAMLQTRTRKSSAPLKSAASALRDLIHQQTQSAS